ncbi:hypothetical protein QQS21_006338 [Conoideocrella luteorostrata]|uniref:Uncharacterized protein n=1 Tax=Conoideocrella luteorostrata TaxID=1105319 RepID=A0AAJ0FYD0_9HYPO|nr:hypothetical protein QQS21_006338 [Conoideocrella luteorostrata]
MHADAILLAQVINGEIELPSTSPHVKGQEGLLRLHTSGKSDLDNDVWISQPALAGILVQNITALSGQSAIALQHSRPSSSRHPGAFLLRDLLPAVCQAVTMALRNDRSDNVSAATLVSLQRLRDAKRKLNHWEETLPAAWEYEVVPNVQSSGKEVYPRSLVIFSDMRLVGPWMSYWLARHALLRSLLLLCTREGVDIEVSCLVAYRDEMLRVCDLICSSIPGVLGRSRCMASTDEAVGESPPAVHGFFSIRALYTCAQTPMVSEIQRKFIAESLNEIGLRLGIRQALVMKSSLLSLEFPK